LDYRWRRGAMAWQQRHLVVTLDLDGGFQVRSDAGAAARFVETGGLLAFYDREGGKDDFLDLWLLALGLTPMLDRPTLAWRDRPSDRLLPMPLGWRLLRTLTCPMGGALDSRYHRHREGWAWHQVGHHVARFPLGVRREATTRAVIEPHRGCVRIGLEMAGTTWEAELERRATGADLGIPGGGAASLRR